MRSRASSWAFVLFITLGGCSALTSEDKSSEGVPYHLPLSLIRYTVDQGARTAKIDTMDVVDKHTRYLAYRENGFADENVCVDRTSTGLLNKVYFGSQDRTPDILLNISQLLAEGFQADGARKSPQAEAASAGCSGTAVSPWMDPYDEEALAAFNRQLCGTRIKVPRELFHTGPAVQCPKDAVCFATKSDFFADLVKPDGAVVSPTNKIAIATPRDIDWIKVREAFFNKRITQLDFDNGVLTTMRVRKESEILGLSQLPLNVVERVLAVPGNAIGMAFGTYQEKLFYLQRRKELHEANSATAPAAPPAEPAVYTDLKCAAGAAAADK
ncbi:MAG: hypothetical protein IKE42_02690 [Aquamicrobium sp.]|nr:hypothetical protein [Aquamicrobium sp.]